MNLPGVPSDFQPPQDPGDLMAWLKNFAEKIPKYAAQLELTAEDLAMVQESYDTMRAAKEAEETARLRIVEARLCTVPDGWPIHITWAAMALGIMAWGPGRISLDRLIERRSE